MEFSHIERASIHISRRATALFTRQTIKTQTLCDCDDVD